MKIEQIIKGCKKGDRKCQKALYDNYATMLMNVSRRYTNDMYEAQDALQNAFIKIFTKLDLYDENKPGSFEGWMSRIVINESIQIHRKKKGVTFREVETTLYSVGKESGILEELEAEEILKLLDQLPEGYRVVFNLFVVEEYNHKEIAETLGITESTSRSQLARARKCLQKILTDRKKNEHAA